MCPLWTNSFTEVKMDQCAAGSQRADSQTCHAGTTVAWPPALDLRESLDLRVCVNEILVNQYDSQLRKRAGASSRPSQYGAQTVRSDL